MNAFIRFVPYVLKVGYDIDYIDGLPGYLYPIALKVRLDLMLCVVGNESKEILEPLIRPGLRDTENNRIGLYFVRHDLKPP